MKRLPYYHERDLPGLLGETDRMTESFSFPTSPRENIAKITFICGCHGAIIGSFRESENGTNSRIQTSADTFLNKVFIPPVEFEYTEINTHSLNVFLSTTATCFGAPTYRAIDSARIKQKFVNDIMEELTTSCPTNTLIDEFGEFGDTMYMKHHEYLQEQRQTAARTIQRMVRKTKRRPRPRKTRLVTYEKERVNSMVNKVYSTVLNDVATSELYQPSHESDHLDLDLTPTDCDAHKLIMIVTRYTGEGCVSEKYVLLSLYEEMMYTEDKLEALSSDIAKYYMSIVKPIFTGEVIKGIKTESPSYMVTLYHLILLAKKILRDLNGNTYAPIDFYDLTCNSFSSLHEPFKDMYDRKLKKRELSIIRLMDDHIRGKGVAYGGKN